VLRFAVLSLVIALSSVAADAPKPVSLPTQPTPKEGGWRKMHAAHVELAKKGDIPLLFLGDSITEYWAVAGKEVWAKNYAPLKAANFGIAADKIENVLWRTQNGAFDGIKPKVVVLLVGINNWRSTSADMALGIKEIISTIHAKSAETKILLLGIYPCGGGMERRAKETNAAIAKFDDGKKIRYLDIGEKFLGQDGKVSKDLMPDGLHLSEKGYEIWAATMAPLLKEMLEQ
jgi:lysophospholipase L1-like esterase